MGKAAALHDGKRIAVRVIGINGCAAARGLGKQTVIQVVGIRRGVKRVRFRRAVAPCVVGVKNRTRMDAACAMLSRQSAKTVVIQSYNIVAKLIYNTDAKQNLQKSQNTLEVFLFEVRMRFIKTTF